MERRERAGRVAMEAMEGERAVRVTGGMAAERAVGCGEDEGGGGGVMAALKFGLMAAGW